MNHLLSRALAQMEIADCGCSHMIACGCLTKCDCPVMLSPPCEHVLARKHGKSIEEWAELLLEARPGEYAEPPLPPRPMIALTRPPRVAIMAERRAAGFGLRHPEDLDPLDVDRLGRSVKLARNYTPREQGVQVITNSSKQR